jgi:BirA family biotin operon repressor/biotin-[acetyl-CoA-carboxylase] ligase
MNLAMEVLHRLAGARAAENGAPRFVSGSALAKELSVTRSAVWKAIVALRGRGTEIEAITHRGYRLLQSSSPLTTAGVIDRLTPDTRARLRHGECLPEISSTNSALLERGAPPPGRFDFLTAEYQSAGRGRLGRSWLAPPGGAICMSWSWCFPALAGQIGALSLATGVAVLRALAAQGIQGVRLKWPNDLVTERGKLGGILIEMRSEAAGPLHVVVGLGLNVTLGGAMREFISAGGNRPADLAELSPGREPPHREALVAALLEQNVTLLHDFATAGFASVRDEYLAADALRDRAVQVLGGGAGLTGGIARGVDAQGALLVEHDGRLHGIVAGEISVRPDEDS